MRRFLSRYVAPVAVAGAVLVGVSACSGGASTEAVAPSEDAVIVDVRSPSEYEAGHLNGAVLLDLNAGQFAAELPTLDPEAEYLVYCRSGNRSGQAVAMMEGEGFVNVTDLGSMENASEITGIEIVTD